MFNQIIIYRTDRFLITYSLAFLISAVISLLFFGISDPKFALIFGIISMGLVCFYPMLFFPEGNAYKAYAPYSIVFAVNCVSFLSLGIGAWSLQYDRYNMDISIAATAWAELVAAISQFLLNFTYLFCVSRSYQYQKNILLQNQENPTENTLFVRRNYDRFGLILIFLTAIYICLRFTVFAESGSVQAGIDSSMTSSPAYAVGFAFITIYPYLICPAIILCSIAKPKYNIWHYLIIFVIFLTLLQSTLRRELLSFFFSYTGSLIYLKKVSTKKIAIISLICLPLIIVLLFIGFIFKQIKQTAMITHFNSSSDFLVNIMPIFYKSISNSESLQNLWQGFLDNMFMRFIGLGSLARVIEKDVFTGGQATLYSLASSVPRFLWPDKPSISGLDRRIIFSLLQAEYDTDRSITYHFQLMADFGIVGLLIGSILFGYLYAYFHSRFLLNYKDIFSSIYYFLILSIVVSYNFEGSLTAIIGFYRLVFFGSLLLYWIDQLFLKFTTEKSVLR
jgi:hypothetical protein